MKAYVLTDFTDKGTKKRSYKGDVIDISEDRFAELSARGIVGEGPAEAKPAEPAPVKEKVEVKQEPEKVQIGTTVKREKKEIKK